jgi:hypothetical protein
VTDKHLEADIKSTVVSGVPGLDFAEPSRRGKMFLSYHYNLQSVRLVAALLFQSRKMVIVSQGQIV